MVTHIPSSGVIEALEAAQISSVRPPSVPSVEAHAKMLNDLEDLRISLAKSLRDAEGLLTSKEAELGQLKQECATLEASDPANDHELDASACVSPSYQMNFLLTSMPVSN